MKVQRICPGCGAKVQFDDEKSKKILCPNCSNVYGVGQFQVMNSSPQVKTPGASSAGGVMPEPPVSGDKLECPQCHTSLKLSTGKSPKNVKCPGCGHVGEFSEFIVKPMPKPNAKPNPHPEPVSDPTVVIGQETKKIDPNANNNTIIIDIDKMRPGYLVLESDNGLWKGNKIVELSLGENIIGRLSDKPVPETNLILPTRDEYMSRKHIVIEMRKTKHDTIEHNLRDAGSKNGTKVNGNRLGAHDVVTLQPGNIIEIGSTKLRFEVTR